MAATYMADGDLFTCPVEATTSLIGKKWVPTIMMTLADQPYRFEALHSTMAASKKVLKQQLDVLIANGLVHNDKQQRDNQVISSYSLTAQGTALMPVIFAMKEWGTQHLVCDASGSRSEV
ncbi:hypothetical protein AYR62_13120 [Secundilactobacillus paracollinoides]|uniref:HTH hxlR-type domain-containing protein n=1 Tax=Secundilactobacillus paracollinoides TaxID=240427 RepID=A0A1B2IWN6_9LACO|nr:helix-turn-helix domain-containing protein [Secundilactobacillus paracollinoides]ANZ60568.1 hypothetical protein AYR61_03880 [Secundilactobacillus paracollinoides]ANZ64921.1 hypothetical protein AYR62_13120 [Secundilactobacillus paracollinoides]ANZ66439.1 hypothetical protein AYR63_04350 [Secundilactobacillus paracollinoides]KRL80998.1 hypothetical protein FC17_GL002813 [Secundilactobacillus paracollinoides DSM 15502 = JCM 11969]